MKDELLERSDLYIVHITGPKELESVQEALALTDEQAKRYIVMGYQNRMGETLAAADCIVSRSGATSLAEISARAIPALLVPFPMRQPITRPRTRRRMSKQAAPISSPMIRLRARNSKLMCAALWMMHPCARPCMRQLLPRRRRAHRSVWRMPFSAYARQVR